MTSSDRRPGAAEPGGDRSGPSEARTDPLSTRDAPAQKLRQIPRAARSVAGALRRRAALAIDRTLHPRRRRQALATLASLPLPDSVLFVCHGNIYRSPYAEAAFRARLAPSNAVVRVQSAGFVGPDRPAPDASLELARSRGLDLSQHRSQLLTAPLVAGSGLIVVMSAEQKQQIYQRFGYPLRRLLVLGDLDPEGTERRTIIDPWNRPPEALHAAVDRIERCVGVLVEGLGFDGGSSQ